MGAELWGVANLAFYISLVLLIIFIVIGVPVPFAFAASLAFLAGVSDINILDQIPMGFRKMSSLTLLAVPFFITMGGFMTTSGIAERVIALSNAVVGRIRSSLGASTVVACAFTGAIAGTCSAAVAAIGSMMIPTMEKNGYDRGYSTGLVACASVLGQLIPPSVPMILYAFVTQQSVLACFLSTVGPGLLLVAIYVVINAFLVRKMPNVQALPKVGFSRQMREVGAALRFGILAVLMPVLILGGIYGGVMTTTEAAAVGIFYVLVVGKFFYKTLDRKKVFNTFAQTSITTGIVLMMVFFVILISRVQTMLNIPQGLIAALTGISENRIVILFMVNIFLVVLGMLVDDFTGTLLAAPLLLPVMEHIGVHPIHFAAILGTNLGLGNVTPPVAPILYLACRIGNVTIDRVMRPALTFMLFGTIPVVIATTYWPNLSLWLPKLLMPRLFGG